MATRTISLFGVSWDVEYTATPFHPATFHEPAYGGEVEIQTISHAGADMTDHLSESTGNAIQAHVVANVDAWAAEEAACAAEDKAERLDFEHRYQEAA